MKGKGRNRGRSGALWGERRMRRCDKVYMERGVMEGKVKRDGREGGKECESDGWRGTGCGKGQQSPL